MKVYKDNLRDHPETLGMSLFDHVYIVPALQAFRNIGPIFMMFWKVEGSTYCYFHRIDGLTTSINVLYAQLLRMYSSLHASGVQLSNPSIASLAPPFL
jgi:hypothetical protein